MAKPVKKINRGLILTLLVVLGVVIYIISITAVRSQYKKEISKIAGDYVSTVQTYSMLPTKYRSGAEKMPEKEFDSFLAEMKAKIGGYCTDNEEALNTILSGMEANLLSLKEGQCIVTEYEKAIKKLSYEFIGDKVTVTLTCRNKYRGSENLQGSDEAAAVSSAELKNVTQESSDTIIFQKIDGGWKIVYAYLETPSVSQDTPYLFR